MNLINLTTRYLRRVSLYLQGMTHIYLPSTFSIYFLLQCNIIWLTKQRYKKHITFSFTKYHMLILGVRKTKMLVLGIYIYVTLDLPNNILVEIDKHQNTKPVLVVQHVRSWYISTGFATLCKKPQLNWPRITHDLILFSSDNFHLPFYQINCNLFFVPY